MKTPSAPSLHALRQQFLDKRLRLQEDTHQFEKCNALLNKNILVVLHELETVYQKKFQHIGFYSPIRGEPSVRVGLQIWQANDPIRKLALPVCKADTLLTFHEWDDLTLMTQGFAQIPEPQGSPMLRVDILLIPCVGWQLHENKVWRLGYGGGFYDKSLQSWEPSHVRPICIGVAFDSAQITSDQWHPQAHDYPLDGLVTESQTYLSTSLRSI